MNAVFAIDGLPTLNAWLLPPDAFAICTPHDLVGIKRATRRFGVGLFHPRGIYTYIGEEPHPGNVVDLEIELHK